MANRHLPPNTLADHMDQLKKIRLLLLDVDGVLTEGNIIYGDDGTEIKAFNVKDGLGLRLLLDHGIGVGIVTGRHSNVLAHRCRDLGIPEKNLYAGVKDKAGLLSEICGQTHTQPAELAFIGDDLPDIRIMKKVGVSIAVADAHAEVLSQADLVTFSAGGRGAVREVCEAVLKSQNLWEKVLERLT